MKIGTFDIETNGLLPYVTEVWCGVVKDHSSGHIKAFDPGGIGRLLHYLDTFDCLVGHNCVGFDFPVLKKIFNYEYQGQVVDTLLMSRLQRPNRSKPKGYEGKSPHSVEAWGYRLGLAKQEHNEWDVYSPEMLERCKQDVKIQYTIHKALLQEGLDMGWENAHRLNVKIFTHLHVQEERGWKIDVPYLERNISTLERWIARIDRALVPHLPLIVDKKEKKDVNSFTFVKKPFKKNGEYSKIVNDYFIDDPYRDSVCGPFSRIDIRSTQLDSIVEVKQFLLDEGWKPEKWNEKDGIRTSPNLSKDDAFIGIRSMLGTLVSRRITCRQRKSVLEGWRSNIRNDGRLAGRVSGIATTGRLRHSLIVNVPSPATKSFFAKQMRKCFIASEGMVMVGADSKGNQMRQMAARMKDDEFTEAVLHGTQEDGTDLHSLNQRRSGAATRTLAKNFFYGGILFGAGDKKIAELLGTTREKARQIKSDYFEEMPKLTTVLEALSKEWRVSALKRWNKKWNRMEYYNGYIRGLDGRSILVPYEKDLLCYALQSDEAIQMGVAYIMVHKWARKKGWVEGKDWGMLIWMHDEFQMECKPKLAPELGELACNAIKWAGEWLKIDCPHDGDYKVGRDWSETH